MANINGQTDFVSSKSGSLISNSDGKYSMKYRGIENLYGDLWQYVDGVNFNGTTKKIFVNRNSKAYKSDEMDDGYETLGYLRLCGSDFIVKMGYDSNYPFIQLPISLDGYSYSGYKDHYYCSSETGMNVLLYGGESGNNLSAGMYNYYPDYLSTNYGLHVGSRLVKKVM